MSLLLLFHSGGVLHKTGSALAVAGGGAKALGAKGVSYRAIAVAGGFARASVTRGAGASARATAGASAAAALSGRTGNLRAHAAAGAYARARPGKGIDGSAYAAAGAYARTRLKPLRIGIPVARLTRLVLFLDPSQVSFTEQGTDADFPLLIDIDTVRIAARAGTVSGLGSTESPSAKASLDNQGGIAAEIVGYPLRVRAELYDHDDLFMVGTVSDFQYGANTLSLTISA